MSIYFIKALFHKYFVTMKYRLICIFFILSESQNKVFNKKYIYKYTLRF